MSAWGYGSRIGASLVRDDTVFVEAAPYPAHRLYESLRLACASSRPVSSISLLSQIDPGSICARVG